MSGKGFDRRCYIDFQIRTSIIIKASMYNAILRYARENIDGLRESYDWKFKEETVPCGIRVADESWYEKNLTLKALLNAAWLEGSSEERYQLCFWYIRDWGGIRTNSEETSRLYAAGSEESILARGVKGIASWSKALTVRNPKKFAIFDARTSISLNAIQLLSNVSDPMIFPHLPSRNSSVPKAQKIVALLQRQRQYKEVDHSSCYMVYNKLLLDIAAAIGEGFTNQQVEMVLFAQAAKLSDDLISRHGGITGTAI